MLLDDVRVMSLAEQYPGPLATSVLCDFGADVVMVERPVGGDPLRARPTFAGLNRNKRSCWIALGVVGEPHLWTAVCEALGLDAIAQLTLAERVARREEVIDDLQRRIGELDLDAFERLVGDSDGIYAVVNTVEETVTDQVVASRAMFVASTKPGRQEVRNPLRFAGHEPPPRPAPGLGLDTDAVLSELGLSPDEISHLRAVGAVGAIEAR